MSGHGRSGDAKKLIRMALEKQRGIKGQVMTAAKKAQILPQIRPVIE